MAAAIARLGLAIIDFKESRANILNAARSPSIALPRAFNEQPEPEDQPYVALVLRALSFLSSAKRKSSSLAKAKSFP